MIKKVIIKTAWKDEQYSAIFATLEALKNATQKYGYTRLEQLEHDHFCILPFYYRHPECITDLSA